ncbi:MAG: histone deacetylase [Acidimicrobiaceae bacterium]|nr:histone deacetylase [Acidimicrobiaceae bacterium]MYH78508.1 histone deacetylase [Acidimicrobiaceae bacterium]MYK75761.1 histone deacetylase [Acidimicrobiaceae bacterium]
MRTVLVITDERFLDHDTGYRHPERPDRLRAALAGVTAVDAELLSDSRTPRPAERSELELVHRPEMIDRVVTLAEHGGGHLDADTPMGAASLDAALLAAGAVLSAVEQLGASGGEAEAYCIVRPPGHHATPSASMGFCLFNSVAVAAASLASAGQRVAIVDIDAHHGNGTQDVFFSRDDVLYASIHQYPLYPGTGALDERGAGIGEGFTINVPLPPGATGEVARAALDEAIIPAVERFAPDWLLVSAGYDGHRADPLTGLCYSSSDYGDFVRQLTPLAPRTVAVLEGGYDLEATRASSYAVAGALLGLDLRPEPASSSGPGMEVVRAAARLAACDDIR